jgi:hypothetical protein
VTVNWQELMNPNSSFNRGESPVVGGDLESVQSQIDSIIGGVGAAPQGMGDEQQTIAEKVRDAVVGAAEDAAPSSGFIYGEDDLPAWYPKPLRAVVETNPRLLARAYDPYLGVRDAVGDERVFMGFEERKPKTPEGGMTTDGLTPSEARAAGLDHNDYPKKRKRQKTLTYAQAINLPYTWDDDEVVENMRKFRKAGINVTDFDGLKNAWSAAVDRAAMMYSMSKGQKKVTPWDVLELHKKERKDAGVFTDFEDGDRTVKYTSVTDISEGASWEVLRTTLSSLLGRDPTDQELRDYSYRMNTLAAKNPSITESITRYKAGEVVSEDRTTTGGFDSADMAKEAYEQAQNDPEYAKVQGGTTLFNALMQALGAVGDV